MDASELRWNEHGVLVEHMGAARKQGGVWVIGNCLSDGHPGKTDGSLLMKSWVALPEKYGGNRYPSKSRADDQYWETVWVLAGRLDCLVQDGGEERCHVLEYPRRPLIEIRPEAVRSWKLPEGLAEAAGVTVLRKESVHVSFEVQLWTGQDLGAIVTPFGLSRFRLRYVEVFSGVMAVEIHEGTSTRRLILRVGDHIFLCPNKSGHVEMRCPDALAHGVVMFLG